MAKLLCFIILLTVGVLLASADESITCSRNEVLNECKNPCLPTCKNPERKPCPTFACNEGCVCKEGLIRDETSGECIPQRLCPQGKCNGPHEKHTSCGSPCQPTCQSICKGESTQACAAVCSSTCVCDKGFVRNGISGKCVSPNECPACECGENMEYTRCGAACIETCQTLKNPKFCSAAQTCKAGCICKEGLILDEATGKCVTREQCSAN